MVIFIVKRNGKEELLKIKEVPFTISKEKGDFTDVSLNENHIIVLGYNEKQVFLKANSKVVYNDREIVGELKISNGESFKAGEIEFHLAKIEFVASSEDILIKSQPTQFIDIEKTEVPYLKIISGVDAGKIIEIEKTGIIGRGEEADYRIDDQFVSRKQAKIYVFDDKYEIEDIGGKNPTLVNGKVITKITPLHSGDEILIGKTRILFVNPKEKTETEIYKSRGIPVYVYGILSLIFIILIALGIWFFRAQQESRYNNLINSVSATIPLIAQFEQTESKVNALERAKNEILQAEKIKKNDQKINELKPIVEKLLNAWKDVQKAETDIRNEDYLSALTNLENAIKILQEDRYVNSLYDQVLMTTLIQQNYSEAKALFEQGKLKEALDVLNLTLSRVPDHPQLLELKNIILTSQKKKTEPKEIQTKLASLKEIKPKAEKKEEKPKVEEKKTSLEFRLKLKFPILVQSTLKKQ